MSGQAAVRRIASLLMPFVGLAALLGGSVFWLRRVGWLQADTYWFSNTQLILSAPDPNDSLAIYWRVVEHHAAMQRIEGWWYLTKFAKEAVLAAFLALAIVSILRLKPARPFRFAYAGLFLLGMVSAATTALAAQWMALAGGVRSFASWLIGRGAGTWLDEDMLRKFARVCAWLLFAQVPLIAIELLRGTQNYTIHLFGHDLNRVVGSFNLPVSLGTFAVASWAAMRCWGGWSRRAMGLLTLALLFVLLFNASASAWVAFVAAIIVANLPKLGGRARIALLALTLPAMIAGWIALPTLTGRRDVHDSLWGRIAPVQVYASENLTTREILLGTGFGLGTNAVGRQDTRLQRNPGAPPDRPVGDSTPAALFWQVGLLGVALAYALFVLALRADARTRPVGIALLICSLSVNVTELFPVNLLLGFWLANAMRARGDDAAA